MIRSALWPSSTGWNRPQFRNAVSTSRCATWFACGSSIETPAVGSMTTATDRACRTSAGSVDFDLFFASASDGSSIAARAAERYARVCMGVTREDGTPNRRFVARIVSRHPALFRSLLPVHSGPGNGVHLGHDLPHQAHAIITDVVKIEVRAVRDVGEMRISTQLFQPGLEQAC